MTTATYDGLSIAWEIIEYIHNHQRMRSRTPFATHYHELVELARMLPRVRNYNTAVTEEEGRVVFLRRVIPGGADRSYGIHVAQLAGLPKAVLHRAEEILQELEQGQVDRKEPSKKPAAPAVQQLSIFGQGSEVEEELRNLDVDSISPIEAINKLYELKKKANDGE